MQPIQNLSDLFLKELQDRYDSEQQQIEAFPALADKASSPVLRRIIHQSVQRSHVHLSQLEKMLHELGADPVSELCEGSLSMIHEAWELLKRTTTPEVTDAAIILSIQQIHHYDIAGYGTLSAFAIGLGHDEIAHDLHEMLLEEKNLDLMLKETALTSINPKAVAAQHKY